MSASSQPKFQQMSVGDRLRYIMEVRCIKQTELAALINIGQAGISNIVTRKSRKPSAPTLLAMAEVLAVNPSWLLNGAGDPYAWAPVTSESQVELLNLFRAMTENGKTSMLTVARCMAKSK